jgi:hypothetical protein
VGAPEYRFLTRWRVLATPEEAFGILSDARDLPRWWPAVYLRAEELEAGGEDGVGRRVRVHTKGWLPYTLDWEFRVHPRAAPTGSPRGGGGSGGTGERMLEADAPDRDHVTGGFAPRSPPSAPHAPASSAALEFNHRWAMARGEESLLELPRRRRCATAERRADSRAAAAHGLGGAADASGAGRRGRVSAGAAAQARIPLLRGPADGADSGEPARGPPRRGDAPRIGRARRPLRWSSGP